jgi:hypothetical protein
VKLANGRTGERVNEIIKLSFARSPVRQFAGSPVRRFAGW